MQRVGYIGKVDGHQVFFNGDFFYAVVNNKRFAIDWGKIPKERKQILFQ